MKKKSLTYSIEGKPIGFAKGNCRRGEETEGH